MSATAIRPKRGFPEGALYCPRCSVVWPSGYPIGEDTLCPMPRPPERSMWYRAQDDDYRCGGTLVPAEEAYQRELAVSA